MSLVSYTHIADGTAINGADVNSPLDTIYNDYNGGITDANISASAAITGSKLADNSISYTKLQTTTIINGEYMRIYKNSAQNITQNTSTTIQFNAATAGYDATLFELNSYGVKILSSRVTSVTVTLNVQLAAAQSFILYIFNNTVQQCALKISSNESGQLAGIVVPVAQNDIITGKIYDLTANGQITAAGDWNFMTVSVNTAD